MAKDAREQEELITQQRSKMLQREYVDTRSLTDFKPHEGLLPPKELRALKVAPIDAAESAITFAFTVETAKSTIEKIKTQFETYNVKFVLVSRTGMLELLNRYDPPPVVQHDDVLIVSEGDGANFAAISEQLSRTKPKEIFSFLMKQAYMLDASDIHIEPAKTQVRIRFRIDGTLHMVAMMASDKYFYVLSDIAARSGITANVSVPQSGRIAQDFVDQKGETKTVGMRVETVPTIHGQDIVVRLFNMDIEYLNLENMGMSEDERDKVDKIVRHPHGLVLVVGPTGSGKSTTLYALLNKLNSPQRKLITLEDPVEFEIDGITQVPVFTEQNDSFSEKLQAVMREDPDIIMVGEIRDVDTARTALQAALTGHLVLATFHASSASAAISRMMDMIGHNPLLVSAVRMIMSQRLIRKIKPEAAEEYQPDENVLREIERAFATAKPEDKPDLSKAKFVREKTGDEKIDIPYSGRLMIMEQLVMTSKLEKLISSGAGPFTEITSQDIHKLAVEEGMRTMLQDGLLRALRGETTLEEVFRVVDIGV